MYVINTNQSQIFLLYFEIFLVWMAKFSILAFKKGQSPSYGANVNTHNSSSFHLLIPLDMRYMLDMRSPL